MAALSLETRNQALLAVAEALQQQKEKIFEANQKDLEAAAESGLPSLYRNG